MRALAVQNEDMARACQPASFVSHKMSPLPHEFPPRAFSQIVLSRSKRRRMSRRTSSKAKIAPPTAAMRLTHMFLLVVVFRSKRRRAS